MSKSPPHPDVLVLGQHPSAYLAAVAIRTATKSRVLHAVVPGQQTPDRLVTLNPEFFELHKSLASLQKKLDLAPVYGLRFLSHDPRTSSEYRHKSPLAYVASYEDVRAGLAGLAEEAGVELLEPRTLEIGAVDEQGLDVSVGRTALRVKAIVLTDELADPGHRKRLGLPESWDREVVHRYSFVRLQGKKWVEPDPKPLQPMSLDLNNELCWGWLLHKGEECQLAVEQPIETVSQISPQQLLSDWASVLHKHHQLKELPTIAAGAVQSMDLPLAGALAHEGVANRTLLVGPAGGFYSATGEDIYPNCWSAVHAADVLRKALKERHLQDAINAFRHVWRTTLGDYLRGPQQNLRFLLPLVYRNQVMTARLTESILQGKSVVR